MLLTEALSLSFSRSQLCSIRLIMPPSMKMKNVSYSLWILEHSVVEILLVIFEDNESVVEVLKSPDTLICGVNKYCSY